MTDISDTLDSSYESDMERITAFVEVVRKQDNCGRPTPGTKYEFSCEAFGEGYNQLYRQLATTINGSGN